MVVDLLENRNKDELHQGNYIVVAIEVLEIENQNHEQDPVYVVFINSTNLEGKNVLINIDLDKTRVITDLEQSVYAFISI